MVTMIYMVEKIHIVVFVNDKECTTVAVNGNMLIAKGIKLKKGDKVSVVQRGKDKIELSRVTFEN